MFVVPASRSFGISQNRVWTKHAAKKIDMTVMSGQRFKFGKSVKSTTAYIDSGNQLTDPLTKNRFTFVMNFY
ncbi:hypothetical protein [Lentibacillus sp. CBA3610]|uniref:hypothetical protein n=1 Tax=Lentibacillus sp. CBA3610 TaxID=2518176 RepID=UPI00350E54EE